MRRKKKENKTAVVTPPIVKKTWLEAIITYRFRKHILLSVGILVLFVALFTHQGKKVIETVKSPFIGDFKKRQKQVASEIPIYVQSEKDESANTKKPKAPNIVSYASFDVVSRNNDDDKLTTKIYRARLLTGALTGPLRAIVMSDDEELPRRTILLGKSKPSKERLEISFDTATFPNGTRQLIKGIALDGEDKSVGLRASSPGMNIKGEVMNLGKRLSKRFIESQLGLNDENEAKQIYLIPNSSDILNDKPSEPQSKAGVLPLPANTEFYLIFEPLNNGK